MARTLLLRLVAAGGAVAIGAAVPAGAQEPPGEDVPVDEIVVTEPEPLEPDPVDEPDPEPPPVTQPEVTVPEVTIPEDTIPVVPEAVPSQEPAALVPEGAFDVEAKAQEPEDPPGNNGTVKVDGEEFDSHPDNQPHVGCIFEIDFYGYDEGDLDASVTFEGVPPTGGGLLLSDTVFIGEDPAGGGTDHDASASYNLSAALAGITPHPNQGHHVKLTVHAEGSQGAATKHKVFWVEGCGRPPPTTEPPPPTTVPTPTTVPPPTTEPTATVPHVSPGPPEMGPPEAPLAAAPSPAVAAHEEPESSLPRTGSDLYELVLGALILVAVGAATIAVARRLHAH